MTSPRTTRRPSSKKTENEDELVLREPTKKEAKADDFGKSNDPVRIYLRKMGSVALLSREGEVVIAKKIEAEENRILSHLLQLQMGRDAIVDAARKFVAGEIRMKGFIKGFDDDEASSNEEAHADKLKKTTEEFLQEYDKYEQLIGTDGNSAQSQGDRVFEILKDLNINRKLMISVIEDLAEYSNSLREAEQDIAYYAKRMGCSRDDLINHINSNPGVPYGSATDREWQRVIRNVSATLKLSTESRKSLRWSLLLYSTTTKGSQPCRDPLRLLRKNWLRRTFDWWFQSRKNIRIAASSS